MSFDVSLSRSGTSYVVTIPNPVVKSLNLKRGQKLDLIVKKDKIVIPLGWFKYILRWETLLEERFHSDPSRLLSPTLLHPIFRGIMQCFFSLGIHLYSNAYGPDHIRIHLYRKIQNEYYINKDEEGKEFDLIKDKLPKIFDQWWSLGNTMHSRKKPIGMKDASNLLDYFESNEFYDFITNEVFEKQIEYEFSKITPKIE